MPDSVLTKSRVSRVPLLVEKEGMPFFAADLDNADVDLNKLTEEEEVNLAVQAEMKRCTLCLTCIM
eukprot:2952546-Ditylum_brightwellii.AAC.1